MSEPELGPVVKLLRNRARTWRGKAASLAPDTKADELHIEARAFEELADAMEGKPMPEPQTPTKEPPCPYCASDGCHGWCPQAEARAAERAQEGGRGTPLEGEGNHPQDLLDDEQAARHSEAMYERQRAEEGGEAPEKWECVVCGFVATNERAMMLHEHQQPFLEIYADGHRCEEPRLRAEVSHLRSVVADQGRQAVLRQGALEEALDSILKNYDENGEGIVDYASRCFAIRQAKALAARAPRTP